MAHDCPLGMSHEFTWFYGAHESVKRLLQIAPGNHLGAVELLVHADMAVGIDVLPGAVGEVHGGG